MPGRKAPKRKRTGTESPEVTRDPKPVPHRPIRSLSQHRELSALFSRIDSSEIHTVMLVFPDMQGRWMGKRLTARFFAQNAFSHGTAACAYLLTMDMENDPIPGFDLTSWSHGYQDFELVPDLSSIKFPAWNPGNALIICDLIIQGKGVEVSPRQLLKNQIAAAAKLGFQIKTASELEFYLLKETYESAHAKGFQNLDTFGWYFEDYHLLQGFKEEPIIGDIRNLMEQSGVPVETSKGEWGPGQHEINLEYAEALEMADRHTFYKHGAKEIAINKGCSITFMSKFDSRYAGSSCHIHFSLWDATGKKALFAGPDGKPTQLFFHFLGGQMALATDLSYFYASTINSYKRYQASTFAPTRIAWAHDNRTCGFRIVGEGPALRIENRIPGADVNPYLAFAAVIGAGLYGIKHKILPPAELRGNAYDTGNSRSIPKSLKEAIIALENSKAARDIFGPSVYEHYLHAARAEQAAADQAVTSWERERYFERV